MSMRTHTHTHWHHLISVSCLYVGVGGSSELGHFLLERELLCHENERGEITFMSLLRYKHKGQTVVSGEQCVQCDRRANCLSSDEQR